MSKNYYRLIAQIWAMYFFFATAKLLDAIAKKDDTKIIRFALTAEKKRKNGFIFWVQIRRYSFIN